ncbi:MAG: hypothetical protein KDB35_19730, partial [Acidimicrobiales bacterium]|nr:hypothetical protein [Acidimicrobiales bacterium]
GRRVEALDACQRLRRLLRDEFGIDPSREIRELETAILQDAPGLAAPQPPPPRALPTPLTSFVGRDRQVLEIHKLLEEHRLVCLLGPGGVGKSRLALRVAGGGDDQWPDGTWWVDLRTVRDPAALVPTLVRTLEVTVPPATPPAEALTRYLRTRHLLLVLDNAENLAGDLGERLLELLAAGPGVDALVTSRIPLGIPGEQRYFIPPLQVPDDGAELRASEAGHLLLDRLEERGRSAPGPDELDGLAELCRRLDGLPLAVELVASRLGPLGLGDRMAELCGEQVSLDEVLAATVGLLAPRAVGLLGCLATFPGTFDLEAARAVGAVETTSPFVELLEASLVMTAEAAPEPRYRLLETTRAFARGLVDGEERGAARRRMASYYRDVVVRAGPAMEAPEEPAWLDRLRLEDHNVRASLEWFDEHDPSATVGFARGLGRAWFVWGDLAETRKWLESVLRQAEVHPPDDGAEVGWAWLRTGWPRVMTGDVDGGLDAVDAAIACFEGSGEMLGLAIACTGRAHMVTLTTGDTDAAIGWYERAIEVSRASGDEIASAWAQAEMAQALIFADRSDEAVDALLDEAEATFGAADDHFGLAHVWMDRTLAAYARDQLDEIDDDAAQGMAQSAAAGEHMYEQIQLLALGVRGLHRGDLEASASLLRDAARLARRTHNLLQLGIALQTLAVHAAVAGDDDRAARIWGAATAVVPVWPMFERRYGELLAPAWARLGGDLGAAMAAGAATAFEDALALAGVEGPDRP